MIHMVHQSTPYLSIDLFAGAGLLGHAFREAGFHAALAVEADHRARTSYANNVGAEEMSYDVRHVREGLSASLVLAGPPCQGFSTLGKGDHSDERNSLSLCVSDWARSSKAQVVIVENVPPFLQSRHWALLKRRMQRMGYESTQWVLNAADFGAPQLRVRAFGVFSRIGLPERPEPTVTTHTTVRQAFEGLPDEPDESGLHVAPKPGALALSRFLVIPENGDKRDVMRAAPHLCPPSWQKLGSQATDVWGRVELDAPANTLRCSFQNASKGRYVHPTAHRVLTLREGARIQGVPDAWRFAGDRMSIARQIGNGVPLALGRAVATSIAVLFTGDRGCDGVQPPQPSVAATGIACAPLAKRRRTPGR